MRALTPALILLAGAAAHAQTPSEPPLLRDMRSNLLCVQSALWVGENWRSVEGSRVVVFYLPGAHSQSTPPHRIASICDRALSDSLRILHERPLLLKVNVFVYPSVEEQTRALRDVGMEDYAGDDMAIEQSIVLIDDPRYAAQMRGYALHEMAHIVVRQRIESWAGPLFGEGLAVYVQDTRPETSLASLGGEPLTAADRPLRDLLGFRRMDEDYSEGPAVIRCLVRRDRGRLDRLKAMLQETDRLQVAYVRAHGQLSDGAAAAEAIRDHYGITLDELQTEVRTRLLKHSASHP